MKIEKLHNLIRFYAGKGETAYYSPEKLDDRIHESSVELWTALVGQYPVTKQIHTWLHPFIVSDKLTLDANGKSTLPSNFEEEIDADVDGNPLDIIAQGIFNGRKQNVNKPPTKEFPIGKIESDNLIVAPTDVSQVNIRYFKLPIKPVFGYNYSGYRAIFDSTQSTEIEWSEQVIYDIAARVLGKLGINMRAQDLYQYAQAEQGGNV